MNLLIPVFSPATGTWGGLTRVLSVADAAQRAGHRVAFCASGYLHSKLEQRGFQVFPTPQATFFGLPAAISNRLSTGQAKAAPPIKQGRDFGSVWFVLLLSGMARAGYLRDLLEAERRAASKMGAEFIFTDLDPGAFLLAEIDGLPIAAAYQTPLAQGVGSFAWRLMNAALSVVLRANHRASRPVHEIFYGPQVLKIIPSIPALEDTDTSRADVRYVGHLLAPIEPAGAFRPAAGKRYIFVYLGTGAVPLRTACRVLPQVFPADGPYRCLVGAQSVGAAQRFGAVEVHSFVPAADVLPYCDWTICHGGQNTIIESLMNDIPLLVFPGPIFERRFNARKIRDVGAGLMGEIDDFTADWFGQAIENRSAYADRASDLGAEIRACGGAPAAISAMQRWSPS